MRLEGVYQVNDQEWGTLWWWKNENISQVVCMCEGLMLGGGMIGLREAPLVISLLNSQHFPDSTIKTSSWFEIQEDSSYQTSHSQSV